MSIRTLSNLINKKLEDSRLFLKNLIKFDINDSTRVTFVLSQHRKYLYNRSFLKHTILSKERDSVYVLYNNNSGFTYYGVQTHIPSWRASERDFSRTTQFPVWPSNSFYDDWISRFAYIPIPVFNWNLLFSGINELYVYYLLDNDNNYYYRVVAKSAAGTWAVYGILRAPYRSVYGLYLFHCYNTIVSTPPIIMKRNNSS